VRAHGKQKEGGEQMKQTISKPFLKAQGARILSELNDLKRTVDSCAEELDWDKAEIQRIILGEAPAERTQSFIKRISTFYPIDSAELTLLEGDCMQGVKFMRVAQSRESARVFDRGNKHGEKTPYYEYRDTAMSCLSAFRPEWIKELRIVNDNNPENPDVAYNNGHFMHQVTFFVGPVNFYYEVNGVKHCVEMMTGDSNYITPFWPHSFTSRSAQDEAYIIAVTFGGDVKRALNELYRYGRERSSSFLINGRNPAQGVQDLLDFHLRNELLTRELLQQKLTRQGHAIDVIDRSATWSLEQLEILATALNIEASDLNVSPYRPDEEVVIQKGADEPGYLFPNMSAPHYHIYPGARCRRMPQVKAFNIHVVPSDRPTDPDLSSALHTYIYNYGQVPVQFAWRFENRIYEDTLHPGDSAYVQPFIAYQFRSDAEQACVFTVAIPGALHPGAQKELSAFASFDRVIEESECWFNA
jgi:uncharacterized RmlC-like cupin family protein